jgi:hypothetical protein
VFPKDLGRDCFCGGTVVPSLHQRRRINIGILRLKIQSKLLYGKYNIENIPMPGKQSIIDDAMAFQAWVDNERETDPSFHVFNTQKLVNSTLIALKRYLMIQHSIVEFNKFKVIDLYLQNNPPLVDKETFDFINFSLHHTDIEVDAEKLSRMVKWHDVYILQSTVWYCIIRVKMHPAEPRN